MIKAFLKACSAEEHKELEQQNQELYERKLRWLFSLYHLLH